MPNTFDIEDDIMQEADTGAPDSLVDAITPSLKEDEELETAKPMEAIPPNNEGETPPTDNPEPAAEGPVPETSNPPMDTPEEPVANEAPAEPVPYDQIEDDVPAGFDPASNIAPINGPETNNVPDTTPNPDDKDQGNFDGPMKYQPLYQRRNEGGLEGFGSDYHSDTPANQYDINEVNVINELVASEASAMDEYTTAAKNSKLDTLQRLFSDIANEERFHLEQLLYAKSVITGEKYIPRDPDVKNEYKELVAMGMDEETAMTTAVDKIGLMPQNVTPEDVQDAAVEVIEMRESFEMLIRQTTMVLEAMSEEKDEEVSNTIMEAYNDLMDIETSEMIQEAMGDMGNTTKGFNPFTYLAKIIKKIYEAILRFIKKIKVYVSKFFAKNRATREWIKANGIKGLFQNGIKLYCFDEKQSGVDKQHIMQYCKLALDVTQMVAETCNVSAPAVVDTNLMGPYTAIHFKTIDEGVTYLKGTPFVKSKVIVTDDNEEAMEALFFGISAHRIGVAVLDPMGNQTGDADNVSANVYNQYLYILERVNQVLQYVEAVLDNLQGLSATPNSVYYSKRLEVYDPCEKAMADVVKAMEKLSSCLTSDIQECVKLNNGLMELVKDADAQLATKINTSKTKVKAKEIPQVVDTSGRVRRTYDEVVAAGKSGTPHRIK